MPKIRFKRGLEEKLPLLSEGEPGFTTDTEKLFIGASEGNVEFAKKKDVDINTSKIAEHTSTLENLSHVDANAEMLEARGTYPVLGDRLNDVTTQLAQKANQSFVDSQFASIVSGAPKGTFSTLDALQTSYPNGTEGVFLTLDNGHWYYWNNDTSTWVDGGIYQASQSNEFPATNLITNGDFNEGITGWTVNNADLSAVDKSLSVTGNGSSNSTRANFLTSETTDVNDLYYVRAKIRALNPDTNELRIWMRNGGYNGAQAMPIQIVSNPIENEWYDVVFTSKPSVSGKLLFQAYSLYADASAANGKTTELQFVSVINLTKTFGIGNEPTLEEFKQMLSIYPNSHFNGTVGSLLSSKDIYNDYKVKLTGVKTELENQITSIETTFEKSAISLLDEKETYDYAEYIANVKNNLNITFGATPIKIYASFKQGECLDESCIEVKRPDGSIVRHQWDDERNVNYQYDRNFGRYPDGSLKDGSIVIIDSLLANASVDYDVTISKTKKENYLNEIVATYSDDYVYVEETSDFVRLYKSSNVLDIKFESTNKYLSQKIINNGTEKMFIQNPEYHTVLDTPLRLVSDNNTTVKTFFTYGNGVVFREFNLVLTNDLFDYTIVTRVYRNQRIELKGYFKAKRLIVSGENYGMLSVLNFKTNQTNTEYPADGIKVTWQDNTNLYKMAQILFCHGDVPRDASDPPKAYYPVWGALSRSNIDTTIKNLHAGWKFKSNSTLFDIPQGEVFASGIVVNLREFSDSAENERDRNYNLPVARLSNNTKYKIKSDILNLVSEDIFNVENHLEENYSFNGAQHIAKLALWKMYGIGNFETINADFKQYVSDRYADGDTEGMWSLWGTYGVQTQVASRDLMPMCVHLLKEHTEMGNTSDITYFENVLKSYAEVYCRAYEAKGYVGLNSASSSANSNSTASALSGLGYGLKLEPTNTRWQTAYNALKLQMDDFKGATNMLIDASIENPSTAQYLHYASYAAFEFEKAKEYTGDTETFNMSAYLLASTSAYGAMREQETCGSASRRGLGHTLAYIVYLLVKENTPTSLEQAKTIMERLVEQSNPSGGHKFPLEQWKYIAEQPYESSAPYEVQVLSEVMYLLLEQNIKTKY